jgi:hypothetical protein
VDFRAGHTARAAHFLPASQHAQHDSGPWRACCGWAKTARGLSVNKALHTQGLAPLSLPSGPWQTAEAWQILRPMSLKGCPCGPRSGAGGCWGGRQHDAKGHASQCRGSQICAAQSKGLHSTKQRVLQHGATARQAPRAAYGSAHRGCGWQRRCFCQVRMPLRAVPFQSACRPHKVHGAANAAGTLGCTLAHAFAQRWECEQMVEG